MAILKHIASKNANYGSAIDYLKYQHDEFHLVPVLDESGNMLLREEFYLDVQEHGYDSYEKLSDTADTIQSKMAKARSLPNSPKPN